MKPKEYIEKYNLKANPASFSHKEFISDMTLDFMTMVEMQSLRNNFNYNNFKVIVSDIKAKFDSISNKSVGFRQHESKLWNYFFATVVVKARDHYFGEYLKKKADDHRKRVEEREAFENQFRTMHEEFFSRLFKHCFTLHSAPVADFAVLEITESSDYTVEKVSANFRRLSMTHHPDRGGKHENMLRIVEAKNKCMAYLQAA